MKKALFFDIDGTLMQHGKKVMESTVKAIQKAREKGHLVFVCTGRSRVMIPENPILQIGFDGVIGACGMYGEYEGKTIFNDRLEQTLLDKTMNTLENYNSIVVWEGNENLYYSLKKQANREKHWLEKEVEKEIPNNLLPLEENLEDLRISKWSCMLEEEEAEAVLKEFSEDYEVLRHEEFVVEFIGKGHSKGSGIKRLCEYLGISMEDTVAFGDSVNDVEMLKACKMGVVMGNGSQIAKKHADYITDDIDKDGIYKACMHLGLI